MEHPPYRGSQAPNSSYLLSELKSAGYGMKKISPEENLWISLQQARGSKFQIDNIVFSKTYTGPAKNLGRGFILWH